jgi:hypothetical protein
MSDAIERGGGGPRRGYQLASRPPNCSSSLDCGRRQFEVRGRSIPFKKREIDVGRIRLQSAIFLLTAQLELTTSAARRRAAYNFSGRIHVSDKVTFTVAGRSIHPSASYERNGSGSPLISTTKLKTSGGPRGIGCCGMKLSIARHVSSNIDADRR